MSFLLTSLSLCQWLPSDATSR